MSSLFFSKEVWFVDVFLGQMPQDIKAGIRHRAATNEARKTLRALFTTKADQKGLRHGFSSERAANAFVKRAEPHLPFKLKVNRGFWMGL